MVATEPTATREPTAGYGVFFTAWRTPCPRCGSRRTRVYHTDPAPRPEQEFRFRYHLCRNCGGRFRSQEPCALETRS